MPGVTWWVFGLILGAFFPALFAALAPLDRVGLRRHLPDGPRTAGQDAGVDLELDVPFLFFLTLEVQEHVPALLGEDRTWRCQGAGHHRLRYRFQAVVRGLHPLGPLEIRLSDPLGLVVKRRRLETKDLLEVWPKADSRRGQTLARRALGYLGPGTGAGAPLPPVPALGGESLQSIDWAASARRGRLMRRMREAAWPGSFDLAIQGDLAEGPRFEAALEGAASLSLWARKEGVALRLSGPDTTEGLGAMGFRAAMRYLAGAVAHPWEGETPPGPFLRLNGRKVDLR